MPTRARKTRDIYVVQGNYGYGHGWEDLTAEPTRAEALLRLREYRANESAPFRLRKKREKIVQAQRDARRTPKMRALQTLKRAMIQHHRGGSLYAKHSGQAVPDALDAALRLGATRAEIDRAFDEAARETEQKRELQYRKALAKRHASGAYRDPTTHRGNADLIRWYLKQAHEVERQLFGPGDQARKRKARATVAHNVQVLRKVSRQKAIGFVRSLGYRG